MSRGQSRASGGISGSTEALGALVPLLQVTLLCIESLSGCCKLEGPTLPPCPNFLNRRCIEALVGNPASLGGRVPRGHRGFRPGEDLPLQTHRRMLQP